jgi:hypothetical protein
VGRRAYEAPEVYAVTRGGVRRLKPARGGGALALDWSAADARALELSHVLLTAVVPIAPDRALEERFMHDVVLRMPDDGFVLGSDVIVGWLKRNGPVRRFAHPRRAASRLPLARLRSWLHLTG